MKKFIFLIILLVFVLVGCQGKGDTSSGIGNLPGTGHGNLSNIDPLNNGLYQFWMFGDNTYVFCTTDKALIDEGYKILKKHDSTVYFTYRDWKAGDVEFDSIDGSLSRVSSACGQKFKDTHGSKLLSIQSLSNED